MDLFFWVALALLVVGVVGSVLPFLPGAILSVVGVLVYWWSTGFSDPGLLWVFSLLLAGVVAIVTDYGAGVIAARVGGASTRTSILAGAVGFVLLFVLGPIGLVLGVAGTVFVVEYLEHEDVEESGRRALYTTIGVLASSVVQVLLTLSMLVGFVIAVVL
ncbi:MULTISPECIES: DUF456 domain-containing protein [Haloferax]|uniref:DUF456 family protein n=1 Tax=Haloferax marinum TaxID=2666143 RepID=A0A6A8G9I2_9EURY|nr:MULTISPECIES: DUF456 domain-containing protein [Haloferax]KAB1198762.1 DUF456 domain-containing protein [Haloferax sp. CBA1150]MRW97880.1 DUF456 family protein [Haloferax marinum]